MNDMWIKCFGEIYKFSVYVKELPLRKLFLVFLIGADRKPCQTLFVAPAPIREMINNKPSNSITPFLPFLDKLGAIPSKA